MRCVVVLFLALAAPVARAQAPDSTLLEGIAIDRHGPTLFHFQLGTDHRVLIQDLGQLESLPSPADGFPELPDSARASLSMSSNVLRLMEGQVSEALADAPMQKFGVSVKRERLRLQFDQGLPIWAAIALALALAGLGGVGTAVVLLRRESARKAAEDAIRQRTFQAREAERSRLAREIHDGPLQDVHALRLLASETVEDEAGRIARDLRAIAEDLRPPALARFGLAAALAAHARRVRERHPQVQIDLDVDERGSLSAEPPEIVRSALFRIAQEALTNAIEHGHATRVRIQLQPLPASRLQLTIADDGTGLPTRSPDLEALADAGHFGLIGMHERAEALGGTLVLSADGLDGAGTRVQATVPVSQGTPASRMRRLRPA